MKYRPRITDLDHEVLNWVQYHGPMLRATIAKDQNRRRSSVNKQVAKLIRLGLLTMGKDGRVSRTEVTVDTKLPDTKTCTRCKETKTRDQFSPNRKNGDGLQGWCKTCNAELTREYYAAHPEKDKEARHKRRARKKNAPRNDFTGKQWKRMVELTGSCCMYCGKRSEKLHIEHKVPLSRGGSHTWDNIVPACPPCNFTKQTKTPHEAGYKDIILADLLA